MRPHLLERLDALKARLAQPTPRPLEGQQAIPVATITHHAYKGPGACQADWFGIVCGEHREAHQILEETH